MENSLHLLFVQMICNIIVDVSDTYRIYIFQRDMIQTTK